MPDLRHARLRQQAPTRLAEFSFAVDRSWDGLEGASRAKCLDCYLSPFPSRAGRGTSSNQSG